MVGCMRCLHSTPFSSLTLTCLTSSTATTRGQFWGPRCVGTVLPGPGSPGWPLTSRASSTQPASWQPTCISPKGGCLRRTRILLFTWSAKRRRETPTCDASPDQSVIRSRWHCCKEQGPALNECLAGYYVRYMHPDRKAESTADYLGFHLATSCRLGTGCNSSITSPLQL